MWLAGLAATLPPINSLQTVGCLEGQHPPWILRGTQGHSADFIQLPNLVLGECEFGSREIVLQLLETFRADTFGRGSAAASRSACRQPECA